MARIFDVKFFSLFLVFFFFLSFFFFICESDTTFLVFFPRSLYYFNFVDIRDLSKEKDNSNQVPIT